LRKKALKKSQLETDLEELCDYAVKNGATRAKVIDAALIAIDERVQLKCRYPPCLFYGKNLMCPPYTPSAREFREYTTKYKNAIIVQIEAPIDEEIKRRINSEGAKLKELLKNYELFEYGREGWKKLVEVVSAVEEEAFKKGYYLSLGLSAGTCRLCATCDPKSSCKHPWEARPCMEAVGIDVHKTIKNAGFKLKWNTRELMTLSGLILIG
jgi:predicted metal-binding protein